MARHKQTSSEQTFMSKLAMAVAIALVAGVAGYGIGGRSGLSPVEVAVAPEAVEVGPAAPAAAPGLAIAPDAVKPAGQAAQAPATPAERLDDLSQSVGTVCETPSGECLVGQAPINSYCECYGAAGRIVR